MNINEAETIFMLGIGGSGMGALASILAGQGKRVLGTDQDLSQLLHEQSGKYELAEEESAAQLLKQAGLLIYSDAVTEDHPLRRQAKQVALPTLAYHEALGELAKNYLTVAVAGTHGKSSTAAMLGHIMDEAGANPTVLVGARVKAWRGNALLGSSSYLIVEADEYRAHFLSLRPRHAIITSIDFDHPDFFNTREDVVEVYDQFLQRVNTDGFVVTLAAIKNRYPTLSWPQRTVVVDKLTRPLKLLIPGSHMQLNAALAVTAAQELGIDARQARAALEKWQGLSRRLEELGDYRGLTIISDYGHHPTAIKATIAAVRMAYKNKRVLVLFEAHTMERLRVFFDQFVAALAGADGVLLVPVYLPPGREPENEGTPLIERLASVLTERGVANWQIEALSTVPAQLDAIADNFNVALAFTAGDLDQHLRSLAQTT